MPPLTHEQSLEIALAHHRANRLSEAEPIYRRVVAENPRHAPAWYLLGRLLAQRGLFGPAAEAAQKAVAVQPLAADFQNLLGECLRRVGRTDEAIAAHARAAQADPNNADAHNSLGNCLKEKGRLPDAVAHYQKAVALRPTYAEAYSNMGNALKAMGDLDAAIAAHRQAVELKPDSAEILNNFGSALKEKGDIDGAIAAFMRSVALRPDYPEVLNNLGSALILRDRVEEAIAAFTRAAELNPNAAEIHNNLGNVLQKSGDLDASVAAYRRALALRADFAEAHSNLAINLTSQGRLDEALVSFSRAMECRADPQYHGNLLYTIHFHPDYDAARILEEHRRWDARFARALSAPPPRHANIPDPDRRLRIGYVSPDFRHHPVARFLLPLFARHDHARHEIVCYSGVVHPDELTARLRGGADRWVDTTQLTDEQLAGRIRADGIDVLVDLTLHMAFGRLMTFARKPAPVQVTWLGYVSTTGLAAMDYRISDAHLDPPGSDENYTERTVRLPYCNWCYEPIEGSPDVAPLPALSAGHVTFGCFNNFSKVSGAAMALWARIMAGMPGSRLILHGHAGSHQEDVRRVFARAGVGPERIEFVGFVPTHDYLRQHHRVDVALDPFPYAGGTTTCDALWMGVPVVTLAGRTAVGRAGVSLLSNLGLPALIARTPDEYMSIVNGLCTDLPSLAQLRARLRPQMLASPLMDARRFAADMEAAYGAMWARWCAGAAAR